MAGLLAGLGQLGARLGVARVQQAPPRRPPPVARLYPALLTAGATGLLDASGNGLAVVGPSGIGNTWAPSQVAVSTTTNVSTPEAFLYLGPLLPLAALAALMNTPQLTQLGGTANGSNDSIGLVGVQVPQGQALIVQWQGGDPGATAIMTVTGNQVATYWR